MTDSTATPVQLPGSSRRPVPGAMPAGPVPPEVRVAVTVVLRRRAPLDVATLATPIAAAEFASRFGAAPADVQAVVGWAAGAGLEVAAVDVASRRIRLVGAVGAVAGAFATALEQAQVGGVQFRQRQGSLHVPASLAGVVVAVLGLDDRPQAHSRRSVAARADVTTSYTPPELARIYGFPAESDGSGQTIAIIELGGGYRDAELDSYFSSIGLPPAGRPHVAAVGVDSGQNAPSADSSGPDGEVLLDIEVAGALAPGAAIVVYFAPNSDAGFLDAVSEAAHASPPPTAMSISWGQSEDQWTAQARNAMDAAFADAAALGVTVTVAAGDDGSTDRSADGAAHVDFPAGSPHVLACGGTSLHADADTGQVAGETVWNNGTGNGATGGGVSHAFARPTWQRAVGVPHRAGHTTTGRGVPDVAAVADPRTGYQVLVDGDRMVIGGTSAVAPLWAALVARLVQQRGAPLGLVQPLLYAGVVAGAPAVGLRDILIGDNGDYHAGPGWDACTGLGVPDGAALVKLLGG